MSFSVLNYSCQTFSIPRTKALESCSNISTSKFTLMEIFFLFNHFYENFSIPFPVSMKNLTFRWLVKMLSTKTASNFFFALIIRSEKSKASTSMSIDIKVTTDNISAPGLRFYRIFPISSHFAHISLVFLSVCENFCCENWKTTNYELRKREKICLEHVQDKMFFSAIAITMRFIPSHMNKYRVCELIGIYVGLTKE